MTLLFALAAQDSTAHVDAIRVLANFCMDELKVEQLKSCSTPEEIFNLLMAESEASN